MVKLNEVPANSCMQFLVEETVFFFALEQNMSKMSVTKMLMSMKLFVHTYTKRKIPMKIVLK